MSDISTIGIDEIAWSVRRKRHHWCAASAIQQELALIISKSWKIRVRNFKIILGTDLTLTSTLSKGTLQMTTRFIIRIWLKKRHYEFSLKITKSFKTKSLGSLGLERLLFLPYVIVLAIRTFLIIFALLKSSVKIPFVSCWLNFG